MVAFLEKKLPCTYLTWSSRNVSNLSSNLTCVFINHVINLVIQFNMKGKCVCGSMPEWLKGADCKSAGYAYVGSNPTRPIKKNQDGKSLNFKKIQSFSILIFYIVIILTSGHYFCQELPSDNNFHLVLLEY